MKAKGCKHLLYDENNLGNNCTIARLGNENAVWERAGCDPKLVQFCKLRGRLNDMDACTSAKLARCGEFEDYEHTIIFRG